MPVIAAAGPLATAVNAAFAGLTDDISSVLTTTGPFIVGVLSAMLGARWAWRKFSNAASH